MVGGGDRQKALAKLPPQLVPPSDRFPGPETKPLGLDPQRDRVRIAFEIVEPRLEVAQRDLGVELDPPRPVA